MVRPGGQATGARRSRQSEPHLGRLRGWRPRGQGSGARPSQAKWPASGKLGVTHEGQRIAVVSKPWAPRPTCPSSQVLGLGRVDQKGLSAPTVVGEKARRRVRWGPAKARALGVAWAAATGSEQKKKHSGLTCPSNLVASCAVVQRTFLWGRRHMRAHTICARTGSRSNSSCAPTAGARCSTGLVSSPLLRGLGLLALSIGTAGELN